MTQTTQLEPQQLAQADSEQDIAERLAKIQAALQEAAPVASPKINIHLSSNEDPGQVGICESCQ